ncbi:hypothetical protein K7432_013552 [Basidiobolus ranarum]|uniref:Protein FAM72A n=1 Tax=Basidiobolus ranarum TaxID=34480 RepID=A0ABR2WJ14_9FUNG
MVCIMIPERFSTRVLHLNCRHCQTIFTERGMKAKLVAQPGTFRYSTDVRPYNCALIEPACSENASNILNKTCACFAQEVGCLGCGTIVGYFIVHPCSTCNTRSTNGHLWVFYLDNIEEIFRLKANGRDYIHWDQLDDEVNCKNQCLDSDMVIR